LVLVALGGGGVADAQTVQCVAGRQLLKQDLTDAAKQRFNKALDEGEAGRRCGIAGLKAVDKAETKAATAKKKKDKVLTWKEARTQVKDFWTQNRVWFVIVLVVWGMLLLGYFIRILMGLDQRMRVKAPASSADLAKAVVAAANAEGGQDATTVKVCNASDESDDTTAADLAKVFRLPGTVPLGDLLKRPPFTGLLSLRVRVSGSVGGPRAVIELTYRQRLKPKRYARIAVDLGDMEDSKKSDVLALIGGAWLNAMLQTKAPMSVRDQDAKGLEAHALFTAGASYQTLGKTDVARACYAAMPDVNNATAPFAWTGSRLNEMMTLKNEHRWLEAAQLANEIGDFPPEEFARAEAQRFGEEKLDELLQRQRYMTTILRVDHWYAAKDQHPNTFNPKSAELQTEAAAAVERLKECVDPRTGGDHHKLAPLHAAGRMVNLSYEIASGKSKTIEDVRKELGLGGLTSKERPTVHAAGYYDAACAVSLLLEQLEKGNKDRDQRVREGLWLLETAFAATPEGHQARVTKMAKADPMLEQLKKADAAGFAKAIGEDPPADEAPAKTEVPFYFAGNGARSRSAASTSSS
jgi:hypothetical protein